MKKFFSIVLTAVIVFWFPFACAPPQVQGPPGRPGVTCIQGTVLYRSPVDSAQTPYANATVTAWRHDTNKALVDTRADGKGRFGIEVPLGDFILDLKV